MFYLEKKGLVWKLHIQTYHELRQNISWSDLCFSILKENKRDQYTVLFYCDF